MIRDEIENATHLYRKYRAPILKDPIIAPLINRYKEILEKSSLVMEELGISAACASCAGRNTSGCCFSGVEEWYDCYILLINLLLNAELPVKADFADSCLFVGEKGCKLKARHSFCVNFMCPDLQKSLAPAGSHVLLNTIGMELQTGWELERYLRDWISREVKGVQSILK